MSSSTRRSFLKLGLIGTITVAAAGGAYRLTREHSTMAAHPYKLDSNAKDALAAIALAFLAGILPTGANARSAAVQSSVSRIEAAIHGLPLAAQQEIADLFGLLTLAPTRRVLAGVSHDWPEASTADVAEFLQAWRNHRFQLMQSAYQALHALVFASWYANETTWTTIGYPGPRTLS